MVSLGEMGKQIAERWKSVNFGQKLVIIALMLSSIVVITILARKASSPDMNLLFAELDPKDAAEIVNVLESEKVPYELRDGGTTVRVPAKRVNDLRMRLLAQGLPKGSPGFEIFDKQAFGTTGAVQEINRIRALQGELARNITSLQQVEWARVMIVVPPKALFVEEEKEATASVVLKLRQGYQLADRQMVGVTSLVARSVEGLHPRNVVITDDQGNLLSHESDSPLKAAINSQHAARNALEKDLASKAQRMLETVLGSGKSIVSVSAELDFQRTTKKDVRYNKGENKLPSRMVTISKVTSSPRAGGATGTSSNIPSGQTQAGGGISNSTETQETTEYFEPRTRTETEETQEPGKIVRLSIAVFTQAGTYKTVKDENGTETQQYQTISDEERQTYIEIVKTAVGFSAARKDEIVLSDKEFSSATIPISDMDVPKPSIVKELMPSVLKYGSIVLSAMIFVMFAKSLVKGTGAFADSSTTDGEQETETDDGESAVTEATGTIGTPAAVMPTPQPAAVVEVESSAERDVSEFARQNMADTTRVLRNWLHQNAPEQVAS